MTHNTTIIVTRVLQPKGTAFATCVDTKEAVFIPPKVSRAGALEEGDVVSAVLAENSKMSDMSRADPVKWVAIYVDPEMSERAASTPHSVSQTLSKFDFPVTADDAGLDIVSLEAAHRAERAVKIIVCEHPRKPKVVMWAATMDQV